MTNKQVREEIIERPLYDSTGKYAGTYKASLNRIIDQAISNTRKEVLEEVENILRKREPEDTATQWREGASSAIAVIFNELQTLKEK